MRGGGGGAEGLPGQEAEVVRAESAAAGGLELHVQGGGHLAPGNLKDKTSLAQYIVSNPTNIVTIFV